MTGPALPHLSTLTIALRPVLLCPLACLLGEHVCRKTIRIARQRIVSFRGVLHRFSRVSGGVGVFFRNFTVGELLTCLGHRHQLFGGLGRLLCLPSRCFCFRPGHARRI
jgi:hypothetical protein